MATAGRPGVGIGFGWRGGINVSHRKPKSIDPSVKTIYSDDFPASTRPARRSSLRVA